MEDMERYGDYNEIDTPPGSGKKLLILKIIVAVICFSVISLLIFRIIIANHYPDFAKKVYFDPVLEELYRSTGGDFEVLTQNIRSEYDDPDEGNIFCDKLFIIREADQLQVAVRFNRSVEEKLSELFGEGEYDVLGEGFFTFRLVRDNPNSDKADSFAPECVLGTLTVKKFDTLMQYGYYKLVFNGVDFDGEEFFDGKAASWIRLETFLDDGTGVCKSENKFTNNLIYENHADYNRFDVYEMKEKP